MKFARIHLEQTNYSYLKDEQWAWIPTPDPLMIKKLDDIYIQYCRYKKFSSFKIYFEWKVSPGSNSGFMWGVREDNKYKHPYSTGPEIQILDRDFTYEDGSLPNPKHTAGALYDLVAPEKNVTKKAGEWNSFLITIDHIKNHGEVIHNGTKVSTFPLSGENWEKMVKNSKFSNYRDKSFKHGDFGKFKKGHLVIQDHPGIISYRNMKILEIN